MEPSSDVMVGSTSKVKEPQVMPQASTLPILMEEDLRSSLDLKKYSTRVLSSLQQVAEVNLAKEAEQKLTTKVEALKATLHTKGSKIDF
ncbi:hypothetical protein R1sor_014156 [Riccia sorocarpa]|uniref:Uncharacterized protein n=1 Tax=Riccia sorocarpa TaxID=122646 RepID=A0ABD3HB79_9MARC